jgi:hypothetical protein
VSYRVDFEQEEYDRFLEHNEGVAWSRGRLFRDIETSAAT